MSHVGVLPLTLSDLTGHTEQAQLVPSSMGMEPSELVARAQQQQQLLAEAGPGAMLSPSAQPTGGGLTQPLQQGQQGHAQPQGQDPLQSLVQQLLYLQQLEYLLAQRGHI